MKQDGRPYYKL